MPQEKNYREQFNTQYATHRVLQLLLPTYDIKQHGSNATHFHHYFNSSTLFKIYSYSIFFLWNACVNIRVNTYNYINNVYHDIHVISQNLIQGYHAYSIFILVSILKVILLYAGVYTLYSLALWPIYGSIQPTLIALQYAMYTVTFIILPEILQLLIFLSATIIACYILLYIARIAAYSIAYTLYATYQCITPITYYLLQLCIITRWYNLFWLLDNIFHGNYYAATPMDDEETFCGIYTNINPCLHYHHHILSLLIETFKDNDTIQETFLKKIYDFQDYKKNKLLTCLHILHTRNALNEQILETLGNITEDTTLTRHLHTIMLLNAYSALSAHSAENALSAIIIPTHEDDTTNIFHLKNLHRIPQRYAQEALSTDENHKYSVPLAECRGNATLEQKIIFLQLKDMLQSYNDHPLRYLLKAHNHLTPPHINPESVHALSCIIHILKNYVLPPSHALDAYTYIPHKAAEGWNMLLRCIALHDHTTTSLFTAENIEKIIELSNDSSDYTTQLQKLIMLFIENTLLTQDVLTHLLHRSPSGEFSNIPKLYTALFNKDTTIYTPNTLRSEYHAIIQEIKNGSYTYEHYIGNTYYAGKDRFEPTIHTPLDPASTQTAHTTSVKHCAIDCAEKLHALYNPEQSMRVNEILKNLAAYAKKHNITPLLIEHIQDTSNQRAQHYIHWTPDNTNISIKVFLALAWKALCDTQEDNHPSQWDMNDGKISFLQTLREAIPGYHEAYYFSICPQGGYNAVLEALVGHHTAAEMIVMTPGLLTQSYKNVLRSRIQGEITSDNFTQEIRDALRDYFSCYKRTCDKYDIIIDAIENAIKDTFPDSLPLHSTLSP